MKVIISPGKAKGRISAPPSKSVTHRALIAGALSEQSTVHPVIPSGDVEATLLCLETLGAKVEKDGDKVTLGSLDPMLIPECTINCGESGSTLRFLLPLCLLSGNLVTMCGTEKLMSRPLGVYESLCRRNGFTFEKEKDRVTVAGKLSPGIYAICAEKSSQFATGMIFALSVAGGGQVLVGANAESGPYIDITVDVMKKFGADAVRTDVGCMIGKNSKYQSRDYKIEGDLSNAAFLSALTFVGGDVKVTGVDPESIQGDRIYPTLFKMLKYGSSPDVRYCPDLAPVLLALASFSGGGTLTGTKRLKYKESDRAAAMKEELEKFGIKTEIDENSVTVSGKLHVPDAPLGSHNDHRIAMALSVLCTVTGGEIEGAEAVAKSYPHYWSDLEKLGIEVTYE